MRGMDLIGNPGHKAGICTWADRECASWMFYRCRRAHLQRNDLVIYEVVTDEIDATWWQNFRRELEREFRQEKIVIRSQSFELV